MLNLIKAFVACVKTREEGQTIVEYGLVVGGISLALIAVFATTGLGTAMTKVITDTVTALGDRAL